MKMILSRCFKMCLVGVFIGSTLATTTVNPALNRIDWVGDVVDRILGNLRPSGLADLVPLPNVTTTTPGISNGTASIGPTPGVTSSPKITTAKPHLSKSLLSRILGNLYGNNSQPNSNTGSFTQSTEPNGGYVITTKPSISAVQINAILNRLNSSEPAASATTQVSTSRDMASVTTSEFTKRYTTTTTTSTTIRKPTLPPSTLEFIAQSLVNFPDGAQPLSDGTAGQNVNANGTDVAIESSQQTSTISPSILNNIARDLLSRSGPQIPNESRAARPVSSVGLGETVTKPTDSPSGVPGTIVTLSPTQFTTTLPPYLRQVISRFSSNNSLSSPDTRVTQGKGPSTDVPSSQPLSTTVSYLPLDNSNSINGFDTTSDNFITEQFPTTPRMLTREGTVEAGPEPTLPHRLPKLRRPVPIDNSSQLGPTEVKTEVKTEATDEVTSIVTQSSKPARNASNRMHIPAVWTLAVIWVLTRQTYG